MLEILLTHINNRSHNLAVMPNCFFSSHIMINLSDACIYVIDACTIYNIFHFCFVFWRWQIYLQKERCIYEQKLQSPEINIIIQ